MRQHFKTEGLVIKKTKLLGDSLLITIFTPNFGKITVSGFGVKKITSRRLSHLETGNYIRFSYSKTDAGSSLGETDLQYGYSKIRRSEEKLHILFVVFLVLNKVLPENEPEPAIFHLARNFLKDLNNKPTVFQGSLELFLTRVLLMGGFIDEATATKPLFKPIRFTENLIGQKIR